MAGTSQDTQGLLLQLRSLAPKLNDTIGNLTSAINSTLPELKPLQLTKLDPIISRLENITRDLDTKISNITGPLEQKLTERVEVLGRLQEGLAQLGKLRLQEALLALPRPGSVTLALTDGQGSEELQVCGAYVLVCGVCGV